MMAVSASAPALSVRWPRVEESRACLIQLLRDWCEGGCRAFRLSEVFGVWVSPRELLPSSGGEELGRGVASCGSWVGDTVASVQG